VIVLRAINLISTGQIGSTLHRDGVGPLGLSYIHANDDPRVAKRVANSR